MYARKDILPDNSHTHITFRCLNREFLFKDDEVKTHILFTWLRYLKRYKIEVYAFIIMDNHAHLIVKTPTAEHLGHFMRITNSLIARYVNKFYGRDSHALKERYKSPIITNHRYLKNCLQYLWLNRYRVDQSDPSLDPFCSLSWQINPQIITRTFSQYEKHHLLKNILTTLEKLPVPIKETYRNLNDLLNEAKSKSKEFKTGIFQNSHTIGDVEVVAYRGQDLSSKRREYAAWIPI